MTADTQTKTTDPVAAERARLEAEWPQEYRLGFRFGFLGKAASPCDTAGYPIGLASWPLDRRNAWWAGWNEGRNERDRRIKERRR
jgi:hypothetical protein